jgi:hypothetical protein
MHKVRSLWIGIAFRLEINLDEEKDGRGRKPSVQEGDVTSQA